MDQRAEYRRDDDNVSLNNHLITLLYVAALVL